jgi:hypothetical protein
MTAGDSKLETLRTRELLSLFAHILEELKRHGVVRSSNNPVADYTGVAGREGIIFGTTSWLDNGL